jgi:hypothetical protein
MSKAPEGFMAPTRAQFEDWRYLLAERLSEAPEFPDDQTLARARFEADRGLEALYSVTCEHGWIGPNL